MAEAIAYSLGLGFRLVWVCFLSWVISRFAFDEALPVRRAALTSGTAFAVAVAIELALIFLGPDPLPGLRQNIGADLLVLLLYIPAALIDFLLLRSAFRKGWVDDAEPFR
jgi:hypothetical protein